MSRLLTIGWELGSLSEIPAGTGQTPSTGSGMSVVTSATTPQYDGNYCLQIDTATLGTAVMYQANFTGVTGRTYYSRFAFKCNSLPTSSVTIASMVGGVSTMLNADGSIALFAASALRGSSTPIKTGQWVVVEHSILIDAAGTAGRAIVRVEGVTVADYTGALGTSPPLSYTVGVGNVQNNLKFWFDNLKVNDDQGTVENSWPNSNRIGLLVPVADSSIGSGWQKPGGAVTNLYTSIDTKPPVGGADSTSAASAENLIRNASALTAYVASLQSFVDAGYGLGDTNTYFFPFAYVGAPVTTSGKSGSISTTNPTNAAVTFGTFWSGSAAAAWPTGWKYVSHSGVVTNSGTSALMTSVTTRPTLSMSITAGTTTRIADVAFMGALVEIDPAIVPQTVASSQGTLTPTVVTPPSDVALTGQQATVSQGNTSVPVVAALTGAQASVSPTPNPLVASTSPKLTTQLVSGVQTTPVASSSLTLKGQSVRTKRNELSFTEQFENSYWGAIIGRDSTRVANQATAPDGTLTADLLYGGSGGITGLTPNISIPYKTGESWTYSQYFKKQPGSPFGYIRVNLTRVGSNSQCIIANLTDGTYTVYSTVDSGTGTVEVLADGWIRVSHTLQVSSDGDWVANTVRFFAQKTSSPDEDITTNSDGLSTSGIYTWGAQLEYGSSASTYQSKNGLVTPLSVTDQTVALTTQLVTASQTAPSASQKLGTQVATLTQTKPTATQSITTQLITASQTKPTAAQSISGQSATAQPGSTQAAQRLTGQAATSAQTAPSGTQSITGSQATVDQNAPSASNEVIAPLVGWSMAIATGNIGWSELYTLLGQQISTTGGVVAPDLSTASTGQQASTSAGSLFGANTDALAGSTATSTQGTTGIDLTKAITGQSFDASPGTVSGAQRLSGAQATTSTGSILFTRSLIGEAVTATFGFLDEYEGYPLTTSTINVTPGVLGADLLLSLTGQSTSTQTGLISQNLSLVSLTFAASTGNLSAVADIAVVGSTATASQGSVIKGAAAQLSGSSIAMASGSIIDDETNQLDAQTVATQTGSIAAARDVALTGQSITGQQGIAANLIVLSGSDLAVANGTAVPYTTLTLTGLVGFAQSGSLFSNASTDLTGSQDSVVAGGVSQTRADDIAGELIAAAQGSVGRSINVALSGQHLPIYPGTMGTSDVPEFIVPLSGQQADFESGALTHVIYVIPSLGGGEYDMFGADIRNDILTNKRIEQDKEWLAIATQEDKLLLATIKSTLGNPKYGF